jgi:hypothetical protein
MTDVTGQGPQAKNECGLLQDGQEVSPPGTDKWLGTNAIDEIQALEFSCNTRSNVLVRWQSVFALLVSCGTVRLTVEQYETLRETLIWQVSCIGDNQGALPGIRKIQRVLTPMMREYSYARSKVEEFRKRGDRIGKARVILPSEWAIFDTSTGVLYEAMFGRRFCPGYRSSQGFVFGDIEDVPIVRNRARTLDMSEHLFLDSPEDGAVQSKKLPVLAGPHEFVEVSFLSSEAVNRILRPQAVYVEGEHYRATVCMISAIWQVGIDTVLYSPGSS